LDGAEHTIVRNIDFDKVFINKLTANNLLFFVMKSASRDRTLEEMHAAGYELLYQLAVISPCAPNSHFAEIMLQVLDAFSTQGS
jgi:hypothetical protein